MEYFSLFGVDSEHYLEHLQITPQSLSKLLSIHNPRALINIAKPDKHSLLQIVRRYNLRSFEKDVITWLIYDAEIRQKHKYDYKLSDIALLKVKPEQLQISPSNYNAIKHLANIYSIKTFSRMKEK